MNHPEIGTRYLALSDEGNFLDSASVSRLRDRARGKPMPKSRAIHDPEHPVNVKESATEGRVKMHEKSVASYRAALVRNQAKRDRHNLLASEFEGTQFSWFRIDTIVKRKVASSDVRIVATLRRKNGAEMRADIITGTLYDEAGLCLSSDRRIAYDTKKQAPCKKARIAYLDARRGGEAEDAE